MVAKLVKKQDSSYIIFYICAYLFLNFIRLSKLNTMEKQKQSQRLLSLDALRGFDMFFIMGGGSLFVALATLVPTPFFESIAAQMSHAKWGAGFTFEDIIFPLFLFIAGISFPFSLEKQRERGMSEAAIYKKIIRRGITLVVLGFVYNGLLNLNFETQRYASVLARIGLGWMFGALIFVNTRTITRVWIVAAILIGYWLLLFIPAPDGNGEELFTREGNLACYIDRLLLPGRLHGGNYDPEGILSTLPAIGTALLGMFTGEFVKLRREGLTETKKVVYMLAVGGCLLAIGLLWGLFFPINKYLWTSSFVCTVGGISAILFAVFYYIVDVKECRGWTLFFTVIGTNSITIYLAQVFINFTFTANAIFGGFIGLFPETAQPLLGAIAYIAVCWGFLYFLYRQRIFLKV